MWARSKKGMTLIEILLAIALIGLLVTTVTPRLRSVFRASVKSGVRRYAAMVRFAYDQAVLTGRVHRVVLDLAGQTWRVEAGQPGALPLDKEKVGLLPDSLRDRVTSEPAFQPIKSNVSGAIPNGVEVFEAESWRKGKITHAEVAKELGEKLKKTGLTPKEKEALIRAEEFAIYAYPSGFIDEATVVLTEAGKEGAQVFRIKTKSLSGRIEIDDGDKK